MIILNLFIYTPSQAHLERMEIQLKNLTLQLSTKVKYRVVSSRKNRALYFPPRKKFHTRNGLVAQLVRALACHARGRGFEPHPSRHFS